MTPEQFTYWLQGFAELASTDTLSPSQWLAVKNHLNLVFDKKTPTLTTFALQTEVSNESFVADTLQISC